MAPFIPVSNVVRVRILYTDDVGTTHGTRFFLYYPGAAPSSTDLDNVSLALSSSVESFLVGMTSTEKTYTEIRCDDLSSDTAASGYQTFSYAGTRDGNYLTANVAANCEYVIDRRYRGGHPRGMWPFGVQGDLLDAAHWSPEVIEEFYTAIVEFCLTATGITWSGSGALSQVDVSYRLDNAPRAVPVTYPVVGYVVNSRVGSQRRRLGRSSG